MDGICRICGEEKGDGIDFDGWVKDTFTNYDLLFPGEVVCKDCLFWFDQRSAALQERMGKDKPQKMQNYSHFVVNGEWLPVSKGNKGEMARLLLATPFPELAAIAVSGQKHLAFRARRNGRGQQGGGWVQFEEQAIFVEAGKLGDVLKMIEELYVTFSKGEIESGKYYPARILEFGLMRWYELEQRIKPLRQAVLFQLALYLAQRSEDGNGEWPDEGSDGDAVENNLEGDTGGLQEPLPDDDLGAVRKRDPERGLYRQPGEVYQLDLFADAGGPGADGGGEGGGKRDSERGG